MKNLVIEHLKSETESIILFHSATGKDSMAILDMLHPFFKQIICVYMYIVPDLRHINKYIAYHEQKYKVKFLQVPHFLLNEFVKNGHMGIEKNEKVKLSTLSQLDTKVRVKTGINYSVYGFKKSDSMNLRFMLKDLLYEGYNPKTHKAYPLTNWNNSLVLKYIAQKRLLTPLTYDQKTRSTGFDITDVNMLMWLKKYYPDDLEKVTSMFPATKTILFEYEYQDKNL
jgi:3'-phosphoadenosine 5'-phosphosulfate sulfotransferase (PAPS reductase)/FAD synthetase